MITDQTMHTPRPWKWEAQDASMTILGTSDEHGGIDHEHQVLAVSRCKACQKDPDRMLCMMPNKADADLIEAAPDLLHACKLMLDALAALPQSESRERRSLAISTMWSAIDHAEGRKS